LLLGVGICIFIHKCHVHHSINFIVNNRSTTPLLRCE
jgi:hypothetical protein